MRSSMVTRSANDLAGCEIGEPLITTSLAAAKSHDILVIVGADHHGVDHARKHARCLQRFRRGRVGVVGVQDDRLCRRAGIMPISNETRVRVEFFWKIMASAWPSSGASSSGAAFRPIDARGFARMRFIEDGAQIFAERALISRK